MNWRQRSFALACAALVWSIQLHSHAADSQPTAKTLFDEGVSLLEKHQLAEACPKFEQSLAIDRQAATWFALADCNAQLGRVVPALKAYMAYVASYEELPTDKRQKHAARINIARSQMEALRPLVSAITVVVPSATTTGFLVSLDGEKAATQKTEIELFPLEPGEHQVVVLVAGAEPKESNVTLEKGEHRRLELVIPIAPKPKSATTGPNSVAIRPVVAPLPGQGASALRIGGIVSLGIGATSLVVGGVAAALAISKMDEIKQNCALTTASSVAHCQTQAGFDTARSAQMNANLATAGFSVALVGAVTGTILLLRDRSTENATTKASRTVVAPRFGADKSGVRVFLEGVW